MARKLGREVAELAVVGWATGDLASIAKGGAPQKDVNVALVPVP